MRSVVGLVIPASGRLVQLDIMELPDVLMFVLPCQHMTGTEDGEGIRPEADTGND